MKKIILIIACAAFIGLNAFSQNENDVPEDVKSAFSKKFPNAKNVKWDSEEEDEWEAEFKMDGKEYSANFDDEGIWLETEYEISIKEIPDVVKKTLDNEFPGFKISESAIAETADGKVFEFELKKGKEKAEIEIDTNGKVLTEEQDEETDDDNDD